MNFHRKIEVNWWGWALVSVPWILVALLRRWEDKAGDNWSDWSSAIYDMQHGQWRYCRETVLWDLLLPILVGWIAQYFITMAWHRFRQRPAA
jgi:hypothetical protein